MFGYDAPFSFPDLAAVRRECLVEGRRICGEVRYSESSQGGFAVDGFLVRIRGNASIFKSPLGDGAPELRRTGAGRGPGRGAHRRRHRTAAHEFEHFQHRKPESEEICLYFDTFSRWLKAVTRIHSARFEIGMSRPARLIHTRAVNSFKCQSQNPSAQRLGNSHNDSGDRSQGIQHTTGYATVPGHL